MEIFGLFGSDFKGSIAVERRGTTAGWIVGLEPLDDLDTIEIGIFDEDAITAGDGRRLAEGDAVFGEISSRRLDIVHTQGEMARAGRIGFGLEQEVQLLRAEVEPDYGEIERLGLRDLPQAQNFAIETPTASQIGDENRDMVNR